MKKNEIKNYTLIFYKECVNKNTLISTPTLPTSLLEFKWRVRIKRGRWNESIHGLAPYILLSIIKAIPLMMSTFPERFWFLRVDFKIIKSTQIQYFSTFLGLCKDWHVRRHLGDHEKWFVRKISAIFATMFRTFSVTYTYK